MRSYIVFSIICFASIGLVVLQELPPKFRLQNNVIPKSYSIRIQPFMTNNSFYGEVTIIVELQHSLRNISLNVNNLTIHSLLLDNNSNETKYEIQRKNELINIYHEDQIYIDPGEHVVHVKYSGFMRSDSTGLFKSIFESGGKQFVSAATMFSAPYARMVFPCLDEPAYKSRFSIRLVKPNSTYTALSNMEEIHSFPVNDGIAVDFQTTPPISPYIVCFVFTQYKYRASKYTSRDGRIIPLRFFLLDEYLDQSPFLLDVAEHALQFFEEYTNMSYPTSKLDFIEVPEFMFEGMENVGLVVLTHNSVSFNSSNNISQVEHQQNAAQLIVHEIAHMWFGDIVTPLWYNDLWLAEGFAEFMEIKGLNNQYSKWQLEGLEAIIRHGNTFAGDLAPIVNFPKNNDQVENQFSDLTYSKGSNILNMLELVMGKDTFRNGVRQYLIDFSMSSAATGDFINVMQSFIPRVNIRGLLETWLHQDNFPVVTVKKNNFTNSYVLRQRSLSPFSNFSGNRSTFDGLEEFFEDIFGDLYKKLPWRVNDKPVVRKRWTIPIHLISNCRNSTSTRLIWFDRDMDILTIPICEDEKWTKFNHKVNGFYRVHYKDDQYQRLLNNFHDLDPVDQADLISESLFLAFQKRIPCEVPLKFVGKLKNNGELLPSISAFRGFQSFTLIFRKNRSTSDRLKKYFIDIFKDLYEKLTWRVGTNDEHVVRLLRAKLLEVLCLDIAYDKCYNDAEKVKTEDGGLHPDVNFIWKRLPKTFKIQSKNASVSTADNRILVNSTSPKAVENDLYIEECMSWIKMNL